METFNFKKRNLSSSPHLFGLIGIAAGLFVSFSPLFLSTGSSVEKTILVGAVTMLIGLVILTSYSGTVIDLHEKMVKDYYVFCGYKTGEWYPLPKVRKVKMVASSFRSTNTPNGVSPTLSGKVIEYKVLLYSNAPTPAFSFIYSHEETAKAKATLLASRLGAELA